MNCSASQVGERESKQWVYKTPQNCKAQRSKQDISHSLMIDKPATNTISSKIYNPQVNFGTSAKTDKWHRSGYNGKYVLFC